MKFVGGSDLLRSYRLCQMDYVNKPNDEDLPGRSEGH
jgi:hypothetical protein